MSSNVVDVPVADGRHVEAIVAAHRRRGAAAPNGRHVPAERSQHMVMLTEPGLVVDEVVRLAG